MSSTSSRWHSKREPGENFINPLGNNFGIKNEDTSHTKTNLPQYSNVPQQNNTEVKSKKENFEFL